ncbi:MAG: Crp/Fnr family transcriptional regulator [Burkholderiales bacterium]|nr:MAG: Crp/Fnr family transcriptional regulator [Burkholderiales bacterium]
MTTDAAQTGIETHAQADPELLDALRPVRWLRELAPPVLSMLLAGARLRTVAAGTTVMRRGERVEWLYVVVTGSLELSTTTAGGRRHVSSYLEPGQLFGLIPLLDDRGAIHDAAAHETSRLLTVEAGAFRAALRADPALQARMLSLLAMRSRRLYASVTASSVQPLPMRLARLLLSLHAAYGTEPGAEGATIGLRLSQESLAEMLGVPRQRLNAALKAMERDGIVRMGYSRIVVLDEAALRAVTSDPPGPAGARRR